MNLTHRVRGAATSACFVNAEVGSNLWRERAGSYLPSVVSAESPPHVSRSIFARLTEVLPEGAHDECHPPPSFVAR